MIYIAQICDDNCDINILIEALHEAPCLMRFALRCFRGDGKDLSPMFSLNLLSGRAAASTINPSLRKPLADRQ
jgi:hypothetical protein